MRFALRFALRVALALLAPCAMSAQRPEALWYMVDNEASVRSFLAHADQISIVAPQVYSIDSLGTIWGGVDPRVVRGAREHGVKLVPLVMNPNFDQAIIHSVLTAPRARRRAILSLAALCRDNHFDGLQLDFENIAVTDRDAFTSFSREAADSLHRSGCTLSAAVVPRASEFPGSTAYHRWIYDNWRGAYDYRALAEVLDFISLMTYAQHTGGTTPGPVAGLPWMEAALQYVLSLGVPPAKLSLGLASYSDWWYPTWDPVHGPRTGGHDVSYEVAEGLLARNGVQAMWDDRQKTPYAIWESDGINQFLFIEDARAFVAKMSLVSKYRLRGYSAWVLGHEDPKTWDALRKR
jgi:spore germination protein YaaH